MPNDTKGPFVVLINSCLFGLVAKRLVANACFCLAVEWPRSYSVIPLTKLLSPDKFPLTRKFVGINSSMILTQLPQIPIETEEALKDAVHYSISIFIVEVRNLTNYFQSSPIVLQTEQTFS